MGRVTTPQELDERFRSAVSALPAPPAPELDAAQPETAKADAAQRDLRTPLREGLSLSRELALDLFEAQLASRHLDLAARWLRSFGEGFYTIGSSGHEGNAAVAAAVRNDDPALLHYRSGGFYCARARQVPGSTPLMDIMLGLV